MKTLILAAGRSSIGYVREGTEFFMKRLKAAAGVELVYVKAGSSEESSERLLQASEGCLRIAVDERGECWTTREWERRVRDWQLHSEKRVAFLIGAADGHTENLRQNCRHVLSLSRMTMQHGLALVVLLEQIYRVHTLLSGSPYHRG
ncbi:MAG: 23S rRNA (pseudouridine(1915)-N(3))-methyltransferase RlmH [Akkermansiaceae bacterium]|nr:23S rRNA (pseudouridine(1915)-N(3))-methyltransferase RlmH [Akkermansia sp.]MCD7798283.1 23S rRNA (pseudouridine(1915)-N(3))-methyltransferase RlmH [Akkermansiaceae bacterium]MCD8070764.1 23S rRNA (pseudouridine(1915)-N(3))-methyltransferase RlmH [Akkermansiaceae bacterium]